MGVKTRECFFIITFSLGPKYEEDESKRMLMMIRGRCAANCSRADQLFEIALNEANSHYKKETGETFPENYVILFYYPQNSKLF